jgi:hypothetical protein
MKNQLKIANILVLCVLFTSCSAMEKSSTLPAVASQRYQTELQELLKARTYQEFKSKCFTLKSDSSKLKDVDLTSKLLRPLVAEYRLSDRQQNLFIEAFLNIVAQDDISSVEYEIITYILNVPHRSLESLLADGLFQKSDHRYWPLLAHFLQAGEINTFRGFLIGSLSKVVSDMATGVAQGKKDAVAQLEKVRLEMTLSSSKALATLLGRFPHELEDERKSILDLGTAMQSFTADPKKNELEALVKEFTDAQKFFKEGLRRGVFSAQDQPIIRLVCSGTEPDIITNIAACNTNAIILARLVQLLVQRGFTHALVAASRINSLIANIVFTSASNIGPVMNNWPLVKSVIAACDGIDLQIITGGLITCLTRTNPDGEVVELLLKKYFAVAPQFSSELPLVLAYASRQKEQVKQYLAKMSYREATESPLIVMMVLASLVKADNEMLEILKKLPLIIELIPELASQVDALKAGQREIEKWLV